MPEVISIRSRPRRACRRNLIRVTAVLGTFGMLTGHSYSVPATSQLIDARSHVQAPAPAAYFPAQYELHANEPVPQVATFR